QIDLMFLVVISFFFFQAEDGIRDRNVTGVQTCALPILWGRRPSALRRVRHRRWPRWRAGSRYRADTPRTSFAGGSASLPRRPIQIGRASCRERGKQTEGAG